MGTLAPEVKRLTLSQRLNGKNGHQNTSLTGFLLFFVTCHAARDVAQCHAICNLFTRGGGGGLIYERGGDARRKFWKTPKGDQPWRGPTPSLTPERDHFATRDHFVTMVFCWKLKLVIDVIENFDYMNWVNKTNWLLNVYLRVQP